MIGGRVVITGLGALSAAGRGVEAFWRACVEGRSAIRPLRRFHCGPFGPLQAGEVLEPLPDEEERTAAFALAASAEALASAGLGGSDLPAGSGAVVGTCLGGALAAFAWLDAARDGEPLLPPPLPVPGGFAAPTLRLATHYGLTGPVSTVSAACTSGAVAIARAASAVRRGEADLMLAGGADALSPFVVSGFGLLRALTTTAVRPFDRRRDGLALGEGAAFVVLEERQQALRRGAPILAEVLGSGTASDAYHMTGPSPTGEGALRALTAALHEARRPTDAVDFISAHGTGTPFNDRMETVAFKRLLEARAPHVPIDSIKPIVGHTLGAAGALEAVLCVKVLAEGVVPPTVNYDEPDPDCDLDYVPRAARRQRVRCALSTSSAFAGHNAALALGAP